MSVPLFQIAWHICAKVNICTNYAQYMHARCEFISRLPEIPGAPAFRFIPTKQDGTTEGWGRKKHKCTESSCEGSQAELLFSLPGEIFVNIITYFSNMKQLKCSDRKRPFTRKRSARNSKRRIICILFLLHCCFPLQCLDPPHPPRALATISFLIRCDLMFYLALHFLSLRCRSPYLPGKVSPDCWGNPAPPAGNESGQGVRTAQ